MPTNLTSHPIRRSDDGSEYGDPCGALIAALLPLLVLLVVVLAVRHGEPADRTLVAVLNESSVALVCAERGGCLDEAPEPVNRVNGIASTAAPVAGAGPRQGTRP